MTAREARVTAHAKINLILRILAREESGFHTLETLFARLAVGDAVTVRVTGAGRSVDCDTEIPGRAEQNLAYRAALAFSEYTGWPSGFAIEIEKRIPIGGGLGGGSADAGAVLRALAALSPNQVREAELHAIAATLGSDVPYLTTAAPLALAWGRGERMLALPPLAERDVVLVFPHFSVSTAAAYSWLAASRTAASASSPDHPGTGSAARAVTRSASSPSPSPSRSPSPPPPPPPPPPPQLLSLADLATWSALSALATNDFEPVVAAHHPEIAAATSALRSAGATISLMSGSGSTVFGIFDSPPSAAALSSSLSADVVHTRTLSTVSPVEVG